MEQSAKGMVTTMLGAVPQGALRRLRVVWDTMLPTLAPSGNWSSVAIHQAVGAVVAMTAPKLEWRCGKEGMSKVCMMSQVRPGSCSVPGGHPGPDVVSKLVSTS